MGREYDEPKALSKVLRVIEALCRWIGMGSSQFWLVFLQTEIDIMIFGFAAYTKSSSLESREQNPHEFTKRSRI